jgi:hypothetical protein
MELDDQPISSGTKELRLELSVLLDENSDTPIVVKRYAEVIRVQVHPWYTSKRMAQDALAVLGALGVSAVCRSRPSPVLVAPATEERRQSAPVSMTEDNRRQVVAVTDHLYSLLKSGLLGLDEQRTAEAQTVVRNLQRPLSSRPCRARSSASILRRPRPSPSRGTSTSTSIGQGLVALVNLTLRSLGLS